MARSLRDLARIQEAQGFDRVKLLDDAVEALLVTDESKRKYLSLADAVDRLYRAILPDPAANSFAPTRTVLSVIAQKIRSLTPEVDISAVMEAVEDLLDRSVAAEGYLIEAEGSAVDRYFDLSKIDFEALKTQFEQGRKRTEAEKLKAAISRKLRELVRFNRMRVDYLEKFQTMIDEYNAGSLNIEALFQQLVAFARELNEEEKRGIAEGLSEEELALFDLLTRPDMRLSAAEEREVKKVAGELLEILKREKLVLDWRKRQQTRAAVRVCIEEILDELPNVYPSDYRNKCELVYQHVYDSYFDSGRSVYTMAGDAA